MFDYFPEIAIFYHYIYWYPTCIFQKLSEKIKFLGHSYFMFQK